MAPEIEYIRGGFKVGRKKFRYRIDGEPGMSVTEILDWVFGEGIFGRAAWWGQNIGIAGVQALLDRYPVTQLREADPKEVAKLLTAEKLTVNHVRDAAGDRGTAVHAAAEMYAETGEMPDPQAYPPEQRGYVRSLCHFLTEYQPEFIQTEVVVGSAVHHYAGTFDARVKIGKRTGLIDYKTSKGTYDKQFFQLAAYELASQECGYEPTDFQAIVLLSPDGEFTDKHFEESKVTTDQWLAVLAAFKAQQEAKAQRRAA